MEDLENGLAFREIPGSRGHPNGPSPGVGRVDARHGLPLAVEAGSRQTQSFEGGDDAEIPSGAPDHVVRTVTENGRTLKFTSPGFAKE